MQDNHAGALLKKWAVRIFRRRGARISLPEIAFHPEESYLQSHTHKD